MVIETLNTIDWENHLREINEYGYSVIKNLIDGELCHQLKSDYKNQHLYRSVISMERYNFGKGEYKYYRYPLPNEIQALREFLYPKLAGLANRWAKLFKQDIEYPDSHAEFVDMCHKNDQTRPTPLILRYKKEDYNCLHQDLYGEINFPFQVVILLSEREDFDGGELVFTEQRPRSQSRPHVVNFDLGDAVIFAVNDKPNNGRRGIYRTKVRHGVSEVLRGERYTLGVIFHDAR